jgi:hypothetical protein
MALVERLMGLESPPIAAHAFFAACNELMAGRITATGIKNYLGMNAAASAEFDTLIANAPSTSNATNIANRALYIERVHSVIILANHQEGNPPVPVPGYSTPAEIRTKLGL